MGGGERQRERGGGEGGREKERERERQRHRQRQGLTDWLIKLYFSTVKILAHRPTHISAVATVLLITERERETDRQTDRQTETQRETQRQREREEGGRRFQQPVS